jgi:hypothetical protein
MRLVVKSRQLPLAAYALDDVDTAWEHGRKRPDGVLVAGGEPGLVCFVELKGALNPKKEKDVNRAFSQIADGILHFHPGEERRNHGSNHHEKWARNDDLPEYSTRRSHNRTFSQSINHHVKGIVITFRGGTRIAPRTIVVRGRSIEIAVVQRHGSWGRAEVQLEGLPIVCKSME